MHGITAVDVLSSRSLLTAFGSAGIGIVMFAETGLLVGFFLPGDSLLFTAGVFCTTAVRPSIRLSLATVLVAAVLGALVGAQTGFTLGRLLGEPWLRRHRHGRVMHGIARAEASLARYGPAKAIVLARFVPVVRTVANPLFAVTGVSAWQFAVWQIVGGLVWTIGVTVAGYELGGHISGIDSYLLPTVLVVVLLSLSPILVEVLRARRSGRGEERQRR